MGRNIGSHTDRDAGRTVHQQVGIAAGKDRRLFLRFIEVGHKCHGVLVDIRQHLHGDFGQSRFGISHGRSAVSVHGTEVAVSVYQRIAHGPGLGHIDKGTVDRAVTMGMIFTHGIANDTGTFSVGLVRTVVQFAHGIKDPSLYRFESVPDIRQRSGRDYAHRVINIGSLHCFLQIHILNPVKYSIFHLFLLIIPCWPIT